MNTTGSICVDCTDIQTALLRDIYRDTSISAQQSEVINQICVYLIESFFRTFDEVAYCELIETVATQMSVDAALSRLIYRLDDYIGTLSVAFHRLLKEYQINNCVNVNNHVRCINGNIKTTIIVL